MFIREIGRSDKRQYVSLKRFCGALSTYTVLAGHVEPSLNVSLTEKY
ncbi:hypothetical protein [Dictyobacter vulcani]|nr:hypothetical protein [Dictyobacter vulcani]